MLPLFLFLIISSCLAESPQQNDQKAHFNSPDPTKNEQNRITHQGIQNWKITYGNIEISLKADSYKSRTIEDALTLTLDQNILLTFVYSQETNLTYITYMCYSKLKQKLTNQRNITKSTDGNNYVIILPNNELLVIGIIQQYLNPWVALFYLISMAIKVYILGKLFKEENYYGKVSISFLVVLACWEISVIIQMGILMVFSGIWEYILVGSIMMTLLCVGSLIAIYWMVCRIKSIHEWQSKQKYIVMLYSGINIIWHIFHPFCNIILFVLSLLLQIRFTIKMNKKQQAQCMASSIYIINVVLLAYPLIDSQNIYEIPANTNIFILILILAALQFVIYYKIKKNGAYRFIYELINGKAYNYFEEIIINRQSQSANDQVCSICLEELREERLIDEVKIGEGGNKIGVIMRTPCNHRYHCSCLKEWLKDQRRCPLDNNELPMLFD